MSERDDIWEETVELTEFGEAVGKEAAKGGDINEVLDEFYRLAEGTFLLDDARCR